MFALRGLVLRPGAVKYFATEHVVFGPLPSGPHASLKTTTLLASWIGSVDWAWYHTRSEHTVCKPVAITRDR